MKISIDPTSIYKNNTFENFIAIETNLNDKKIAQSFSKGEINEKVIFIGSTIGNGATHLAHAIINDSNYPRVDCIVFSCMEYLELKRKSDISNLLKKLRNCNTVILLDGFYNCKGKEEQENQLMDVLMQSKAKIIITGLTWMNLKIKHLKIETVTVSSQVERQLIIKNLLKWDQTKLPNSIVKQISEYNFQSVRELIGFVLTLIARHQLYGKNKIDKEYVNQLREKWKN
jgi:chromosomal replication initiation ATPase DnaA